jgi:type I site-specific restriction endonuclease
MTKRAPGKRVDYILFYKPNIPIAIIEAKDNNHRVGDGMQQALEYAEMIDVPFVFSSNGERNRVGAAGSPCRTPPTPPDVRVRIRRFGELRFTRPASARRGCRSGLRAGRC